MVTVRVEIHLRPGVADPEGANTLKALNLLGFKEVRRVRAAKLFDLDLDVDRVKALDVAHEMCRRLLANPVVHDYRITVGE
jgi:phosphoribosylformylglycinamidine synthase